MIRERIPEEMKYEPRVIKKMTLEEYQELQERVQRMNYAGDKIDRIISDLVWNSYDFADGMSENGQCYVRLMDEMGPNYKALLETVVELKRHDDPLNYEGVLN